MKTFDITLNYVQDVCKKRKVSMTKKRQKVFYSLIKAAKALSAYELINCLKTDFDEDFAPMTIYRILKFLQEQMLVHKLQSANKFVACAQITDDGFHKNHHFLICSSCKKVDEIYLEQSIIEVVNINIKNKGFHISDPQLELNGICDNCHSTKT
tara:strand:- start:3813 stop:4274 length:462 start_codon:yes stop_codon:yes gene_type:complete